MDHINLTKLEKAKTIHSLIVLIGFLLLLFSCREEQGMHQTPDEKPNIILIYMDDMGYGDLECYGHPLIKTPHINALAENGIKFTSFYAPAAVCTPSRAGLLTGRYPVRNTPFNFGPESTTGLLPTETTIAEVLKSVGYKTAAIGKWHLGHLPQYLPTAQGFDSYYGLPYSNDMILPWCPWLSSDDKLMLYKDTSAVQEIGKNQDNLTLDYTQQAISFIVENKEDPFFLYLAHSMPHLPISAAEKFRGKSAAGLYGDVIETVDWTIGELLNTLKEAKIEENTLIIFTSDNGPWHNLPERMVQDGVKPWHTGSAGMLRGAKATTYEGGLRVPSIMYWPKEIPPGQVNRDIVSVLDIFPTLANIAGASLPENTKIDGMNLLPLLKGNGPSPRTSFIYCKEKTVQAIRKNEWKLRYTEQDGTELYNLHLDPGEMYNRSEEFQDTVRHLLIEMQSFAKETNADIFFEEN
jgi:arylsulfatase A-like enzyme